MRSVSRYYSSAFSQQDKSILLVIEKAYSSLWQEMTRAVRSGCVEENESLLIYNQSVPNYSLSARQQIRN